MAKSNWTVDAVHSSVDFSIRHLMVTNVKGSFHEFSANIEADANDLTDASIEFVIQLDSIDTRNADRDAHLKTADFFDTAQFPNMTFQSTGISKIGDGEYNVTGNVTLHGVTKSETFAVTFEGVAKDPWGNEKAGFSAVGSLKRADYGLTYNAALETGGVMLGDQVKFTLDIQAAKA